jgi:hypothetical protein
VNQTKGQYRSSAGLFMATASALCLPACSQPGLSARSSSAVAGKPVAIASGGPIEWDELRPILAEASGRQAVDEIALDRELRRELQTAGIQIQDRDTQQERDLLAQTLGEGTDLAILAMREERGLGPRRYAAMLWRSAALRALTAMEASVRSDDESREVELRYGPAWRVRLLVQRTANEAQDALSQISAAPDRAAALALLAKERSIDASAKDAGLKDRMSVLDPALPVAMRQWLTNAKAGELSGIIALDRGFAIAIAEEAIPAREPTEQERSRLKSALTLGKQRLAMDRLAKSLLERARVSVMDQSIGWRTSDKRQ